MLNLFSDNTPLKLTEVAKELKIQPEMALLYLGIESSQVIKMLVGNCTKKSKRYFLFDDSDIYTPPDIWISRDYIPVNKHTINDIRENGKYSTTAHEVIIPDEEGYMTEIYVPGNNGTREEGFKIEATIDTLYITAYHAKVLQQRKQLEDSMRQKPIEQPTLQQGNLPEENQIEDEPVCKNKNIEDRSGLNIATFIKWAGLAGVVIGKTDDPNPQNMVKSSDIRKVVRYRKEKKKEYIK